MNHGICQTIVKWSISMGLCLTWAQSVLAEKAIAGPVQIIADVTAIQASCWDLEVRPGIAFRYGESHGVRMADVLPGGRRRDEFDAAFTRSSMIDRTELCTSIAAKYASEMPGLIVRR